MLDNFFKNKLDESLLKHRIPYDERSWQIVASQLDAQKPKPTLISAWWLLLLLPLAGWNYALQMGFEQQQNSTTAPATAIQAPMVVRDTVYQVVYRNVYLRDKQESTAFASAPETSGEAEFAQTSNLTADFQGIDALHSNATGGGEPEKKTACGSIFGDELSASGQFNELPTALLPVRLHKIVEPKNGRSVHLQIAPFDEDVLLIKPLVEKKRKHAADFESVRLSYQQSVPISPVNESTFGATLGYRLTPKIVIVSGLQYQSASNAISNQELELYHHSPALHQGGDELVDVVYWSSHSSVPLNLEYYFSTKSRFTPFVSIGGLFQNHLSTTLSYNIRTLSQEAYLIEKKILDRHWNSFLTFGVGLDLPLYQRVLGFANLSIRKAVGDQFLLSNEKLMTNGTVGLKYKF